LKKLWVAIALAGGIGVSFVWAADWKLPVPDYAWSFPEDHWAHRDYRTEWWYFTGQLASTESPERTFGYQLTFFRIGLLTEPPAVDSDWATDTLLMGHAAVTDPVGADHRFSELLYREVPFLGGLGRFPDPRVAWVRGPVGTGSEWTLRWNGRSFDYTVADARKRFWFDLHTVPAKNLVLHGPNGFSRKGDEPGSASLYYSFTRLATEGTLRLDDATYPVTGESWMDQEISTSSLGQGQRGWDWFGLQLSDGRDLMLYVMRGKDGSASFRHATLVSEGGKARYLEPSAWEVRITDTWKSRLTGVSYPARWTVEVAGEGLTIDVRPILSDQENRSSLPGGVSYWEGAVALFDPSGERLGRGYVELTGYGQHNRPPV
jgi:predicted secreted hydrolase